MKLEVIAKQLRWIVASQNKGLYRLCIDANA